MTSAVLKQTQMAHLMRCQIVISTRLLDKALFSLPTARISRLPDAVRTAAVVQGF